MRLKRIRIKKFRAIKECDIQVRSNLALVGKNSSGKSSVLRALNAFFNFEDEKEAFAAGRHRFDNQSFSTIDLEFDNLPSNWQHPRSDTNATQFRMRLKHKKKPVWQIYNQQRKKKSKWEEAPPDFSQKLQEHLRFVYVPNRRDHEHASWSEESLLRSAVQTYVDNHTKKRNRIAPKVKAAVDHLKKNAFAPLEKKLKDCYPLCRNFEFGIDYRKDPDHLLLLNDLTLRVTEGGKPIDLADCGSGTQSMTALAIYSYMANATGANYLLGIEEPEQNLHPQAQKELMAALKQANLQFLFTTHSTVMLDELKHDQVALCRRKKEAARGIEVTVRQLPNNFWSKHGLDQERYEQFHRYRNSDFFFASFVVLAESSTDAEIIKAIVKRAGTDPVQTALSVLNLNGVDALPYAYHLLHDLKIPFATVVDKDYFLPYRNGELKCSRNKAGFPQYKQEYKKITLLTEMIPDQHEQSELLNLLLRNHSKAMNLLEKHHVFCFNWAMEIDLVNSMVARKLLFKQMEVKEENQSTFQLLVNQRNALKKLENLLPVVNRLDPRNLPNSYKRLYKSLPEMIKNANKA